MLAQRMSLLSGPGTAVAREAVKVAAAAGRQIIDLAAGEVVIEPPTSVRNGAIAAINAGTNRYTDSIGLAPLREAVAKKLTIETGIGWNTDDIVITAGAKQGLLDAALAVLDPGDEVIIFRPCWPTFPSQVLLAGAKPVFVDVRPPTYIPDIDAIRAAVTPRTKAIIINSPNNPTGAVYDRTTLQAIGDVAINYQLWIVSEECYSSFVFTGGRHESIVMAHPGVRSRTILVNAFSKELAITGWRLGYFAAPPEIVSAAKKVQSHTTSNPNRSIAYIDAIADQLSAENSCVKLQAAANAIHRFYRLSLCGALQRFLVIRGLLASFNTNRVTRVTASRSLYRQDSEAIGDTDALSPRGPGNDAR